MQRLKEVAGLETVVKDRADVAVRPLDFRETTQTVASAFGWRPGRFSRLLIKGLAFVLRPMEQGSYEGRAIAGEPHRAAWVIASPLNVFALGKAGYWNRVVLAARLRHPGEINVISINKRGQSPSTADESIPGDGGGNGYKPGDLENLIWIQQGSEVSLRLVPVARTSHQLSPGASGSSIAVRARKVSPLNVVRRASSYARTVRTARVKNCSPIILARWLEAHGAETPRTQAENLKISLCGNIESQRRACAGPPTIPVSEVKRRVLADPLLASYMQEYGLGHLMSREEVTAEALGYIDEIASDYRVGVVRWFARAVDMLFDRFLTGLEVDRAGIKYLSECESRARLVLVCSHKSYLDPLLIGYTLFRSGMVPPQQAAGLNLSFWPVGWLLRHSGAFYLRRTFAGETLYKEVFSAYVRYLLAENHITVVYIEGTRSRDGKLAKPRTGFMGILEDSLEMGICKEVMLVPVYLGYDKTPEEGAHVKEMAGGRKVSESVKGFGRIYKSMNTRLGKAYVKFGTPLSMSRLLREKGLEGAALEACHGINAVSPVTTRSVASAALLAGGGEWTGLDEVGNAMRFLIRFAVAKNSLMAADCNEAGVIKAIEWLETDGHVTREERNGEAGFAIKPEGRRFLEYNKNLSLHHFAGASLTAAARRGISGDSAGDEDVLTRFLSGLLDEEFVFDPAAGPGIDSLDSASLRVLASLMLPTLECYLVAARTCSSIDPSGIKREDLVARCMETGDDMLLSGEIQRPESVCRTSIASAIRLFAASGRLEERREKVPGHRDKVRFERGERFSELEATQATLSDVLQSV